MNCRKRKSKRCGDRLSQSLLLTVLALISLSAGCARKPWGEPIAGSRYSATIEMLEEMRKDEALRSSCIDADVNIFLTSTVKNRAVSGYVQLMQPSSVKFVTSNPLGQPLVAFVSDGHTVQFVNTIDGYFTDGTLPSFAKAFDIPKVAYTSDWGTWLTARLPRANTVTEIREDEENRGIWIGVADQDVKNEAETSGLAREHVLIDPKNRIVLERAFTNTNGSIDARVSYTNLLPETQDATPLQPGKITISGLDYSGKLVLELSALQAIEGCRKSNFQLKRPPGYYYQPLPAKEM
ncbi:hypothetical protein [Desulfopila aestuarii]|uniref:DUF4292 domain-containing protein n=1 Tax=Desulfopila aestuarii DSM 18488 TaxID=1121416 RepID=A0A1M7YEX2_9BACT|nr:hypothetical protein [Desulfopila aestuarii]SHO51058.1 hypothetical protein SAMN02745220_03805 [Desulfopila aestuarii DSM 18488]